MSTQISSRRPAFRSCWMVSAPWTPTDFPAAAALGSCHRLYCAYEELAGNTFATVKQRIVRHLLDLAACEPDGRLVAPVNQQDLANGVGSVREVVARILQELRAASLVRTSPGLVEIIDPVGMSRELWSRKA
jgi:hypothetical protein